MTTRNEQKVKEELTIFLRNSDILSTTERGVTRVSGTITATAGQTVVVLSNNVVRNIKTVTVNSVAKKPYFDYTPNYTVTTTSITFPTGLTIGDQVYIQYDYSAGTAERIFPDYPEIVYLVDQCPRIGFDIEMSKTTPIGIGETNWFTDQSCTIKVYSKKTKDIDAYMTTIRSVVKANQKLFYHFPIVTISTMSPPITIEYLAKKVFMRSIDLSMRFSFES